MTNLHFDTRRRCKSSILYIRTPWTLHGFFHVDGFTSASAKSASTLALRFTDVVRNALEPLTISWMLGPSVTEVPTCSLNGRRYSIRPTPCTVLITASVIAETMSLERRCECRGTGGNLVERSTAFMLTDRINNTSSGPSGLTPSQQPEEVKTG